MIELQQSYLNNLNNADHFGIITQINNEAQGFTTENSLLASAIAGVNTCHQGEDDAYMKSNKDWNVERLKTEDEKLDKIMVPIRAIVAAHAALPDGFPLKQTGIEFLQMWKDYNFQTHDSYSGETSKVINMWQTVSARQADAEALGIYTYFQAAYQQAVLIQQLLNQRFDELAGRVVGELREARQATDDAIKQLYLVINSMQVLTPSDELTALARKLKTIEDYARQYYLRESHSGSGSGEGGQQGGGNGGSQGGGTNTGGDNGGQQGGGTTPDPGTGGGETPDPGTGGGETPVNPDPGTGGGGGGADPNDPNNSED